MNERSRRGARRSPAAKRRMHPDAKQRTQTDAKQLTHVVGKGARARSRMVDVGAKASTERSATARASIVFPPRVLAVALAGRGPKGAIEETARAAGVLAAKRTAELIPMCHPLALSHVDVEFRPRGRARLEVLCHARCVGPTGVEMEALVGASVAALTIYDMTKGLDHGIRIESVELVEKRGGRSGAWQAKARPRAR